MALSLDQVFAKVEPDSIGYVYDTPIHYIVLNRKDNSWNLDRINEYISILDKIEAIKAPGCLVTIGTGPKFFSIGFDLGYWMQDANNAFVSLVRFQELMARLLTLKVPSMCVLNGTAIAGGYWLGLSHDFQVMNA